MTQARNNAFTGDSAGRAPTRPTRIAAALALALALALLLAAPASAALEQVATFAESGESAGKLNNVSGLAVNTTGAGGVPAGTVYAVTQNGGGARGSMEVSRLSSTGEFREAWGWAVSAPALSPAQFERCGPAGEPAHPLCSESGGVAGEGAGQFDFPVGVAVDQGTGYVYVRNKGGKTDSQHNLIEVFSADGSQLIAGFGDLRAGTVAEEPGKIGGPAALGSIAVDDSGDVYVSDSEIGVSRAMVWKPQSPADYEHYLYAGRGADVHAAGEHLALDSAGNLYAVNRKKIEEFAPGEPAAPACEYTVPNENLNSMTVDPASGEVFYWGEGEKKVIHRLRACDAHGEFALHDDLTLTPRPEDIEALAYNPTLAWEGTHPPGALYAGDATSGRGYIFAPAIVHFPVIESESASLVTATNATLGAQIDPKGSDVHYAFEYETAAQYEANGPAERFAGAAEAPLGGATLLAAQEARAVAATLTGLQPATEYRYRVLATSHCEPSNPQQACQETGKAQAFRTFPAGTVGLPDNRAWELVSPAQKQGGEAFPLEPSWGSGAQCAKGTRCKPGYGGPAFPRQSSPDGEALVYEGFPFSQTEGASVYGEYLSRRTPSGWRTTILAPSAMAASQGGYLTFDAALTHGVLFQPTPSLTPTAPLEYHNLYLQPTADPASLTPLVAALPPDRAVSEFEIEFVGASEDLSRVFFTANDALTGPTPFAPEAKDGGEIKRNIYEWAGGQLQLVNVLPGNTETVPVAINQAVKGVSADGSRVFWSDEAGQLYARVNGESTVEITDPGKFLSASEDGSKVLLQNGHLYDLETEATTDLTQGEGGFRGIAGQSEDLSHIYFVDSAALAPGAEPRACERPPIGSPQEKEEEEEKVPLGFGCNLYAWSEGALTFIATLALKDSNSGHVNGTGGDWTISAAQRTAEASPDGRWLAFSSTLPLTGYDNTGPTCNFDTNGVYIKSACPEAFLYDSATARLRCASCNPSGARPIGPTKFPQSPSSYFQPRYLTDSGRFYFDSQDALSPLDTNRAVEGPTVIPGVFAGAAAAGAEDVYQWQPEGLGSCQSEAENGGCLALLSGGHGSEDSNFLAVDRTGENVFFTTRDQLVPADRDKLIDVYDARESGGFAPEERQVECQGEACQPPATVPNDPTPGSSSFEGAGNVVEKPVAKKHHKKKKHAKKRNRAHKRTANHNRRGAK